MTDQQETPAAPPPTDTTAEIEAMGKAYEALAAIDRPAQLRALHWLGDRLDAESRRRSGRDPWNEEAPF
jgi:hypothetical protein